MTDGDHHHSKGLRGAGWKCSACGKLITRIVDGWVEWLAAEDKQGTTMLKGLRLVHRLATRSRTSEGPDCRYDSGYEFRKDKSIVEGLPLERFVGPDGLMLLTFLAEDELPKRMSLNWQSESRFPAMSRHASCSKK